LNLILILAEAGCIGRKKAALTGRLMMIGQDQLLAYF
jgi:hypothetical protein